MKNAQSCGDYFIKHYKDPYEMTSIMESKAVLFFVAPMGWLKPPTSEENRFMLACYHVNFFETLTGTPSCWALLATISPVFSAVKEYIETTLGPGIAWRPKMAKFGNSMSTKIPAWWFQICFIFTHIWGRFSNLTI